MAKWQLRMNARCSYFTLWGTYSRIYLLGDSILLALLRLFFPPWEILGDHP